MSGLLDNLEKNNYSDGDEDDHINRLFPKCKPRASSHPQQQQQVSSTAAASVNGTGTNIEESFSSGSRTSLTDSISLTNNSHKNINTLNNNIFLQDHYGDQDIDGNDDEEDEEIIIKKGVQRSFGDETDSITGFRCLSNNTTRTTRASFVENNNSVFGVQQGQQQQQATTNTTSTTTTTSALAYPGKATRASSTASNTRSSNSRSARTRRSHHYNHHHQQHSHHSHHQQQQHQQSNIELVGKTKEKQLHSGFHHIGGALPGSNSSNSVKKNSCNQGRIKMECDATTGTLGGAADHFDNGVESGESASSGASGLSHSSSFTVEKNNAGNVGGGLSTISGLGSSSGGGGGGSTGNIGLRDSRIEIAGGREIFSQNRIKAGRRVRGSSSMDSMIVLQQLQQEQQQLQQQEGKTGGASASPFGSLGGSLHHHHHHHHNQQQQYQQSPSESVVKGRRKLSGSGTASTTTTNPLISPTSPVSPCGNIWEPHLPVTNKKNFPFSSSSSSSSRGGGENHERRYSSNNSRHNPSTGGGSYLRNSKSSHSHQSLYYPPYHGREYPESAKKSPSLDGIEMIMGAGNKNMFPQVHQSPIKSSLKSPSSGGGAGLVMKETVFASEITSIEKPVEVVVEGTEALIGGGGGKPKPFVYETPIDGGGEIVFDDIEEHRWRREQQQQQRRSQQHFEEEAAYTPPCGGGGSGGSVDKSQLIFPPHSIKSDDGGDEDDESDSPMTQQQQQHRRMSYHHHHHRHHPHQQQPQYQYHPHEKSSDIGSSMPPHPPRGRRSSSPSSNPVGYESDECASRSVLADSNSRTSPYCTSNNGNKRLIGNIPIAEYEGSPKRYGLRLPTEAKPSHLEIIDPNSPTVTHLSVTAAGTPTSRTYSTQQPPQQLSPRLQSPSSFHSTTRLPGFPHRVVDTPSSTHQQHQQQSQINKVVVPPLNTIKPVLSDSPTSECFIDDESRRDNSGNITASQAENVLISSHHTNSGEGGSFSGRNSPSMTSPGNNVVSSGVMGRPGTAKAIGNVTADTSPDDSIASQQGSIHTAATNSSEEAENHHHHRQQVVNQCDLSGEERDNYLLYEFSETRKVLDEFFKPAEDDARLIGFDDLDYTLRRQAGNSYVGQRLAAVESTSEPGGVEESPKKPPPPRRNVQLNISSGGEASPKLISFQEVLPVCSNNKSQPSLSPSRVLLQEGVHVPPSSSVALLDPGTRDVNDNDIEIETASTNTETDLGDTEVGLQVGHSRNFTLSPETTDCDSNELESEISLDFEASLHSSSRIGAVMPVLEDGLSSGNVSDNEDRDQDELFLERSKRNILLGNRKLNSSGKMLLPSSPNAAVSGSIPNANCTTATTTTTESNPTLLLMKKQISEIEKEIKLRSQRVLHPSESNGSAAAANNSIPSNGGPSPLNLPDMPSGLHGGTASARHSTQMDAAELIVTRAEPNIFDCNDPELEALDPMRPTPPPSPAPSSVPVHGVQQISVHHHSLQSSSSQPQMPLPGRMVSYSGGSARSSNDGINICSSNAAEHNISGGSSSGNVGGGLSTSTTNSSGGSLNSSGLGLLHSSADMILSGDSGIVSSSSASSDIHGIKDVTGGFPKSSMSSSSSSSQPRSTLDHHQHQQQQHHPHHHPATTNVSLASPPSSQQHSEPTQHNIPPKERLVSTARDTSPVWVPRHPVNTSGNNPSHRSVNASVRDPLLGKQRYEETADDDADTDQETDRLLGQNRTEDDYGFYDDKEWKKVKSRSILPAVGKGVMSSFKSAAAAAASTTPVQQAAAVASAAAQLLSSTTTTMTTTPSSIAASAAAGSSSSSNHTVSQKSLLVSPQQHHQQQQQQQPQQQQQSQQQVQSPTAAAGNNSNQFHDSSSSSVLPIIPAANNGAVAPTSTSSSNTSVPSKSKKEKGGGDGVKKKRSKEDMVKNPAVLIEGVLFRARYLGSTQLVCEGQPTKATRMMQAEEAVSRIKAQANHNGNVCQLSSPTCSLATTTATAIASTTACIENSEGMSPHGGILQQHPSDVTTAAPATATGGVKQFMYTNPREASGTIDGVGDVMDDDDAGDSDALGCSAGEEEEDDDDYFSDKPNPILGGSIVDTDALTNETSPGSGRRLSSSPSCEQMTGGPGMAGGSGSLVPPFIPSVPTSGGGGSSLGSGLPHLSPPYGSALPGTMFRLRFVGSLEVEEEVGSGRRRRKRPKKAMVEEVVLKLKAPEGETQPSTEVDLFISTEKIMVLNTDLKEIMMDHALRTISYIADIGDLVVLMARRRPVPSDSTDDSKIPRPPKMICHVFESDEAQYIAQSIGQAFQVAYMEFLKANGIEDHSFVREMDYQEVLNSQEIFGDELQMFAKKELQKEVVVPKAKGEILGVVIVESGWGSMLPTVVIANLAPAGAAARCGQLNIGDQIIAINGVSLVGLPLSTCQNYIKNTKAQTVVKLTVVPCPPVVEVKIKRPDTKYQLGFSVQNGVICSLLRGGIAERGGVRVGHRIIEINNQSVVAVPHEKIVNLLATSVGEINMKTMPTSMFRLLTGQETPLYI